MKITRLEICKVPPSWVWLKVHIDDGRYELGEPYLEGNPESVIAEVRRLEPLLVGRDPRNTEALWKVMYEAGNGYKGGPVTMSAISGIDIALWDLAGKDAGLPLHRLLGGQTRDRIRMYRATGSTLPYTVAPGRHYRSGTPSTGDHWGEAARILVQEWGFRTLKVHFSLGDELAATDLVDQMTSRFAAVREGAGAEIAVAVDLHNPHPAIAVQLIDALAPHRPLFIEEPMPVERIEVLARMTSQRPGAPIAAGERWMGKWPFFAAVSRGAVSVVQPDIAHACGFTECRKIAAIAEAGYAKVAMHCPLSPVSLAAANPARRRTAEFPSTGAQRGQRRPSRRAYRNRPRLYRRAVRSRPGRMRCGARTPGTRHRTGRRRVARGDGTAMERRTRLSTFGPGQRLYRSAPLT